MNQQVDVIFIKNINIYFKGKIRVNIISFFFNITNK